MQPDPNGQRPLARALGLRLGRLPCGSRNDITDVPGVGVGHATLISGSGRRAVRTGVTAIIPDEGWGYLKRPRAGVHVLNGAGEMSCLSQIKEWGYFETPILLSSTMAVGICYDGLARQMARRFNKIGGAGEVVIPVVAECDDSYLNNAGLFPVGESQVAQALGYASTHSGPIAQGCVGAGTGMTAFDFKAGIGSASRVVKDHTLGCLVLANFGRHLDLRLPGMPADWTCKALEGLPVRPDVAGSLIGIVATDAQLHSHDLCRLAQRLGLGAARVGANAYHGSGDIFLAFSTVSAARAKRPVFLEGADLDPFFLAAAETCEESIVNSLFAAHEMVGRDGNRSIALPIPPFS